MRRAKSAKTLRHEATNVLEEFGVRKPPVPVEKIATSLGARLKYSPFDGELAGMLIRGDEGTVIGVNSLHHINRQRFTIAHECGHLLLHKGKDVHIDRSFRVNKRDEKSSQAVDPEEIEANRFAAELLMPYDMIVKELVDYHIDIEDEEQLKELADKYQVSVQALTHRITNVLDDLF
ncbi:ImmA/IrrE family metallo-endopeptidase [Bradyrhizobium sp. LMTR 3]|uniref:ImmA/IrrE family metallo-endopeptidase n=1 Tax=Bradyrhizobium sp. LMTR 3 TaxID=189873 RepID=UPI000810CDD6|nr:ImmA/IrrE family metallo-endopeptidase [Bradyrhizobium sp. LMTR 3]OCK55076.1 hypothetical protein LMTR3_09935 [Bradyrhizobium sp. LMTR 3]